MQQSFQTQYRQPVPPSGQGQHGQAAVGPFIPQQQRPSLPTQPNIHDLMKLLLQQQQQHQGSQGTIPPQNIPQSQQFSQQPSFGQPDIANFMQGLMNQQVQQQMTQNVLQDPFPPQPPTMPPPYTTLPQQVDEANLASLLQQLNTELAVGSDGKSNTSESSTFHDETGLLFLNLDVNIYNI